MNPYLFTGKLFSGVTMQFLHERFSAIMAKIIDKLEDYLWLSYLDYSGNRNPLA
jgi:hypothetical protein